MVATAKKIDNHAHSDTRELLLQVAERLFAERGLDDVSMRLISREAGQKNTSSVHYHFGNREAVIVAVLERRMSVINRNRLQTLAELKARSQDIDLREVVALFVNPLAEHVRNMAQGGAYVRFLAQAYASTEIDIADLARGRWDQSLNEFAKLARHKLPNLPDEIFRSRVNMLIRTVVYMLADMERDIVMGRANNTHLSAERQVEDMINMQTAALTAPC